MRPAGAPPVNQADLPHFEGFSWAAQLQLDLVCISGSDTEQEVRFKTTALGGKRAVSAIAGAIGMRAGQGIPFVVPVVELAQDSYQHKSYGLIYTPEFKVSFWADQEMNAEPGALPEKPAKAAKAAKAAPAEKPESGGRTRRRTRARTRG